MFKETGNPARLLFFKILSVNLSYIILRCLKAVKLEEYKALSVSFLSRVIKSIIIYHSKQ